MMSLNESEAFLPPVLTNYKDQIEKYLTDTESLPIHDAKYSRKFWPTHPQPLRLLNPSLSSLSSCLEVARDPATGAIMGVSESYNENLGSTSKNSFSLRRLPGPPDETVRGSSTNYPFWPGGIPEPTSIKNTLDNDIFNPDNYITCHPKLSRGFEFKTGENDYISKEKIENVENEVLNLADMLQVDDQVLNIFTSKESIKHEHKSRKLQLSVEEEATLIKDLDADSATCKEHVLKISESSPQVSKGTEWAIMVDINSPVDDFNVRVPNPACSYPFELDIFQKQAILHLENKENVFVAAHTSAGKTVVAEYSIGLALKHMTKAIYTSPIKALSNQKYRDLKQKFEDVGLLTGDIQINAKASCLIMTTEILQSMLYNGSDVIRDLEWVIFDEVHYINNAERGHVWEEVIIMLPSHVHIVLLSATVPNTLEFADWIGRIKKRKIFVISTNKRPVPLEHYLYTGTGGKSKDERFMIVDANEHFLVKGYNDSVQAKQEREKKSHRTQGPKQKVYLPMNPKQEMNTWIGLIDHLSKNDLLPIVAFTLSKKRCDQNALQLMSQDLTTQREKGEIHSFIKKCTDRLQGSDKKLRQVIHMGSLLKKGIGIHHSGILPMLKEVVEMLFAKSLVKLLFATETFAMGVNMPARSVVFDAIRKHDGTNFRNLVPSEYIQMAGRAGRRGIDTTGTVIILCKGDVPDVSDLKNMMLGKPTKLESQFKLTYSMILNLLKVESLRVEDMMKRSFSESLLLKNLSKYQGDLKSKEKDLETASNCDCIICEDLGNFYGVARDYVDMRKGFLSLILTHPNAKKKLQPGKIIKISHGSYQNYLACIIAISYGKYTVLILRDVNVSEGNTEDSIMNLCLLCSEDSIYVIEKTSEHKLIEIESFDIIGISTLSLDIDANKIIKNIKEREIPRFKDNPPGQSVIEVITVLQRVMESDAENIEFIDMISDLSIREITAVEMHMNLVNQKSKVQRNKCLGCPQFKEHFALAYKRLKILEEISHLKYMMSEEALILHPEYEMRIQVLKKLGYIEQNNTVTLKGRVACEMGNHELMVTELLFENVLADKPIEEIAALISSLVFQQRNYSEPSLTEDLEKGIKKFKEVATKIGEAQRNCGLKEAVGDFVDQFNFGLCEVVYQWALGLPFDKIIELTDVQEGIIVKCIQRLDETLRDVRKAAAIIGDPSLREKMEQASTAIKRDIVFAASLYTQ